MHLGSLITFSSLVLPSFSSPLPAPASPLSKPPFFLLAGDSTTATQATNGGGWGDGFLNTTLHRGANGRNYGHNGATTVSFRAGGDWDAVLQEVRERRVTYAPYVTIQFGHNDQKPAKNISIAEYTANLEGFVEEVRGVGGVPILVTPLSRRSFNETTGEVVRNLENERKATIQAARRSRASVVDLNLRSTEYLDAIGEEKAHSYNLSPDDNTHLNVPGSQVFGGLVASLIDGVRPELKGFVAVDGALETALDEGEYYWPDVN
ncbi:SGNH hydrolase [Aspergillus steynii IBT 23096]|uniref:SGNH hydrolase n=1 Tax=Aspergillus steynii IBT 23096 TaxID=1392250 RepID=A0A2I2GEI4_9EURO|nr:SGNH hydrolase [Aspergillus steynii IBT 23096]PLB51280.1 SGNH hydrolase [Aspergillus steynii IBT 23096]